MTTLGGGGSSSSTLGGNSSMTTLGGGGSSSSTLGGNSSMTTLGGGGSSSSTLGGNSSMTTLGGGGNSMTSHGGNSSSSSSTSMSQVGHVGGSDGTSTVSHSGSSTTSGELVQVYVSSVTDEPALLLVSGSDNQEVKKESIVTLTASEKTELTAQTKSGKPLLLNGQSKHVLALGSSKILIIHEDGQDWKTWEKTVNQFVSHNPGSIVKPGVTVIKPKELPTLFGKLNFKNQAQKDVKIYEMSGIGEPTVLSPNYVSTFFVKSSRPSATFKAEDPTTHEEYLLNGKNVFKVDLNQNPTTENDVTITSDTSSSKRAPEKSNSQCTKQSADKGPCFSALQHEVQIEASEGSKLKSSSCKRYLEGLLNKCSWRNTTYTANDCHNYCNDNDDKDVCTRVWDWEPQKCTSAMTRYYYSPTATSNCISMDFGGCLGNTNNFATPDACSRACSSNESNESDGKRVVRNTYERRMKKVLDQSKLIENLSKLYR